MACNLITVDQDTYESLQQQLTQLRQEVDRLEQAQCLSAQKQSQEQMRLFVEYTPAAIAMFDHDLRYLLMSCRWREDYGLGDQDIIGRSYYEIFPEIPQRWQEIHQRCLAGAVEKCEDIFTWKDGKTECIKWEIHPWYEDSGEIGGIIMFTEVIAPHPSTEALKRLNEELEALRQSEARLQRLADNVPGMIYQFRLDPDGTMSFPYVSSGCREILGLEPEQIQEDAALAFTYIHPEDISDLQATIVRSAQTLQDWKYEWRIITPEGQQKWIKGMSRPERQPGGEIFWYGCLVDISDRKKTEQALRESEQRLRTVVASTPIILFALDSHGRFTLSEGKGLVALGLQPGQVVGTSVYDLYQDFPHVLVLINRVLAGEELDCTTEVAGIVFDNRYCPLRDEAGEVTGMIGVAVDVTERQRVEQERKHAEAQLQEQEQFLRSIYDGAAQLMFVVNVLENGEFRYAGWNSATEQATGISNVEVIGKTPEDVLGTVNGAAVNQRYKSCIDNGVTISYEECLTLQGQETWWLTTINPLKDSQSRIYRLVGTAVNITKRKQAEEALHSSQHFIQRIADSSPNTIYIYDLEEQRNVYANHEIAEILGYSIEEIQKLGGEVLKRIIHPEDEERILTYHQKFPTAVDGEIFELEYRVRDANGQWRWLYSRDTPFNRNACGLVKQVLGMATDITDRKLAEIQLQQQAEDLENTLRELQRTQAQLIQSEKMSSVGNMVAGVAHEINNPVNFIHGNLIPASEYTQDLLRLVELYQQQYPNPSEEIQAEIEAIDLDFLKEDLIKILRSMEVGTQRIREIVLSLRNFSRLDEAEFKQVDIHEGIDSTLMILHNRLKAKPSHSEISVIKEYGKLPPIECYPGQLNQVFMNILANAIDVLQESLVEDKGHWTNPKIRICTEVLDSKWVAIRIADNGPGIPEEIHSKLFDPFFTTKQVGKGTGLGLSISYQIVVDKHRGKLSCHSTGQGAEFVIQIPITQPEAS